jgi:hypothetical protein
MTSVLTGETVADPHRATSAPPDIPTTSAPRPYAPIAEPKAAPDRSSPALISG